MSTSATSRPRELSGWRRFAWGCAPTRCRPSSEKRKMRTPSAVSPLAIPVPALDEAQHFYVPLLGCKLARRYPDRITLDFFGDQLVCHLTETGPPAEKPLSL